MKQAFLEYFRCPENLINFRCDEESFDGGEPDYFRFGPDLLCYGVSRFKGQGKQLDMIPDLLEQVRFKESACILPFNPTEVANNLRYERYVKSAQESNWKVLIRKLYYGLRPMLPVPIRRPLQRHWLKGWDKKPFPTWPVDKTVDRMFESLLCLMLEASPQSRIPFIWFWPKGKSSCAIMTHDVETAAGLRFCHELMDINDEYGIKSSFQLIPAARYTVNEEIMSTMWSRGFEVNVHDLKHDGHLFDDYEQFRQSAAKINEFVIQFGSSGYRSAVLYRNQEWYNEFKFSYDMSVPNVAHLDPQSGGCCTVMPYFIGDILELPVTTTQDYSLFNVLQMFSQDLWRKQIEQIMDQHGLVSFIVHPDYLNTVKARDTYKELLCNLSTLGREKNLWIALPKEVNAWWRQRHAMKLLYGEKGWHIEGSGAERARVAYATLENKKLKYVFA